MAKEVKQAAAKTVTWPKGNDEGGKFVDYNPIPMKPTDKNQMPPTDAVPLRSRYQRAGGC